MANAGSSSAPESTTLLAQRLCLACGMCCNGALFKDVKLQSGDDAARLAALGLALERKRKTKCHNEGSSLSARGLKFPQPCAALCKDNRCRIYADRPSRCRQFECALLKAVLANRVEASVAFRTISLAVERTRRVRRWLRALRDTDESLALGVRFRRVKLRIESSALTEETASSFTSLTLAVQALNVLLSEAFYPGSAATST